MPSGSSKESADRAPRSPTTATTSTFARAIRADLVVLVADAGLGTINSVRLSVEAFSDFPVIVALNRFGHDLLHARNRDFLVERVGLDVVTAPSALAARLASSAPEHGSLTACRDTRHPPFASNLMR